MTDSYPINTVETNNVKDIQTVIGRSVSVITLITLLFAVASFGHVLGVGGQVQFRSITLSDNGASGGSISSGVGSGTAVTYQVSFKAATTYTIKGIVVDFCDGSNGTPFIGDPTCGARLLLPLAARQRSTLALTAPSMAIPTPLWAGLGQRHRLILAKHFV